MDSQEFRKGDKVKFKEGYGDESNRIFTIIGVREHNHSTYDVVDNEGKKDWFGGWALKKVNKTLDSLSIDDIILENDTNERKVVAVGPEYIATVDIYDGTNDLNSYRISDLDDDGFTVKQDEPEALELTLKEIADKFGVDVKAVKIKE